MQIFPAVSKISRAFYFPEGIQPDPGKVQALATVLLPKVVKDVRSSLGMVNFYRRFFPKPLTTRLYLTSSSLVLSPSREVVQPPGAVQGFETTKQQLVDATLLAFRQQDAFRAVFADGGPALYKIVNQKFTAVVLLLKTVESCSTKLLRQ